MTNEKDDFARQFAETSADAPLFAAWGSVLQAEKAHIWAVDALCAAEFKAEPEMPDMPECVLRGCVISENEEAIAWSKAREAVAARYGVPALREEQRAAQAEYAAAVEAFVAAPTDTFRGLALKASAVLHLDLDLQDGWRKGNRKDIAEEGLVLLSLRDDLLRLASLPSTFAIQPINEED